MGLELPDIAQHPDEADVIPVSRPLRGVTRTLYESGMMMDFQVAEDILERGSEVHRYTGEMDQWELTFKRTNAALAREPAAGLAAMNVKPDLRRFPKEWRGYTRAWQKFKEQTGVEIALIEQPVYDELYGIRGRLDRLVRMRGRKYPAILEIGTGSIQSYKALQMAAYGRCLDPKAIFERVTCELHKDATFKYGEFPLREYMDDVATFLSCIRVNQWKQKNL